MLVVLSRCSWTIWLFRRPLLEAARARGYRVVVACGTNAEYDARLREAGFELITVPLLGRSFNPLREFYALFTLWRLFRRQNASIVHGFTPKAVLYGGLAARLAGVPTFVCTVTGLGHAFGERAGVLRRMALWGYRLALAHPNCSVIFQNADDRALFLAQALADVESSVLIRGSGVDLAAYVPRPEPDGPPVVTLVARLLWDKGVGEFVQAARLVSGAGVCARFVLVGDVDPHNPTSIPRATIRAWVDEGVVEWWGYRHDMPEVYALSHIVCLPSYYREGVPRALIEAAACGRPIVTTDMPGCREVVRHNDNGLLVPPRAPVALAEALRALIDDPERRVQMGRRGRERAVAEFSLDRVNAATLAVYQRLSATAEH